MFTSGFSRQDVPDDERLRDIFSQASRKAGRCAPLPWALSGTARLPPTSLKRTLGVHVSKRLIYGGKGRQLLFIMGTALTLIFMQLRQAPGADGAPAVPQGLHWRKRFTSLLATRTWFL